MTDAEFIADQDQWPKWPYLPLKRPPPADKRREGQMYEWGILLAFDDKQQPPALTIKQCGLHHMPKTQQEFDALPTYEYAGIDALLADQWRVD